VLFERLQSLVSGGSGTYEFPAVIRPTKLSTHAPQHGLIVLTRGEFARVPDLDCPGNPPAIAYQQAFLIRVHIAPSERDPTPIEVYEDIIEAEILKAVRTDHNWHTFDGNAMNAMFQAGMTDAPDGGYEGIAIPVQVTYRIAEGDPYTSRL
jgi:hypothetical protein